jgi:hypothetical protein
MSSRESGEQISSWLRRAAEKVALAIARRCEAAMLGWWWSIDDERAMMVESFPVREFEKATLVRHV